MSAKHEKIEDALSHVEVALHSLDLWQATTPPPSALASTQPFCIDTLTFPQWLQFIFLERIQYLCKTEATLPGQCGIAPMSEEYFRPQSIDGRALTDALLHIDEILAGY